MATGRIHWLMPTLMGGGLILGVVFAVVHHVFYQSLDKQIVAGQDQQEWNIRIGTGLAFLVKVLLTASASMAYTQLLWHTLKLNAISLDGLDAFFGVVGNAWGFSNWELWRRGPALALIALIVWTIPLVAIVTPSTLTVQAAAFPNETITRMPIPVINYAALKNFAQWSNFDGGGDTYAAPSSRISRLVSSVATQGTMLQINAPFPNCSYTAEFYAPMLSCEAPEVGDVVRNKTFADHVAEKVMNVSCPGLVCKSSWIGYVAYVPLPLEPLENKTVEDNALMGLNATLAPKSDNSNTRVASLDPDELHDHARIYLTMSRGFLPNTTVECGLYNASYKVDFTFRNNQQDIKIRDRKRLNGVTADLGAKQCKDFDCSMPSLAYTSLMDALGNILVGYLSVSPHGYMLSEMTQITTTSFMETAEMQKLLNRTDAAYLDETPNVPLPVEEMTMGKTLEEFFTNTTLSLFSDGYFLQNDTTAATGDVTIRTPQNAYEYRPRNLYIAYGSGIAVTFLVVIAGASCIWTSSQSFSTSFSAILRTTRNTELDALVIPQETAARFEPMPKKLAETKLLLQHVGAAAVEGDGHATRLAFTVVDGQRDSDSETMPRLQGRNTHDSLIISLDPKK